MKKIRQIITSIDHFQQSKRPVSFIYAVIKKYGEDDATHQAALFTYYGFLSLFPLLLVTTSVLQLILRGNEHLRTRIIDYLTQYFPIVGDQLQHNIHSFHKAGLALVIGVAITFYGARGVADAVQYALNHLWHVPKLKRDSFPQKAYKSLSIILLGGIGLMLASALSGYAASLGHSLVFSLLASLTSMLILILVFLAILKIGISSINPPIKSLLISAVVAAVGIQILQTIGGYVITHELRNLRNLYGTFAVVLGLLFWLYLQARVWLYAVEIGVVHGLKLWPRSLSEPKLTSADKRAYAGYAEKERYEPPEDIRVKFQQSQKSKK